MSAPINEHNDRAVSDFLIPVLVGGDVLTYSYIREFNRIYGITRCVVIMTSDIKVISSSKFTDCRIVPNAKEPKPLIETLLSLAPELLGDNQTTASAKSSVKSSGNDKVLLLLGSDDSHANIFSENKEVLEKAGYTVPYESVEKIGALSDKHIFYDICKRLEIPYPKTWYFNCGAEGPDTLPLDEFPYPLVAKAADSALFKQADVVDKKKAYEVNTPKELSFIWKNLKDSNYDGELIIQDFIPGNDEALHIVNIFANEEGEPLVLASGHLLLQDHCPSAIGNPITMVPNHEKLIIEQARTFIKDVKFHGWATFDIKYDNRSDEFVFFEINIRPGRSSYYVSLAGKSFIEPIVNEFVLGNTPKPYICDKSFLYNMVPYSVLKKALNNPSGVSKLKDLAKNTFPNPYPLHNPKDSFMHNFWATCMKFNQIRKFNRYLFNK